MFLSENSVPLNPMDYHNFLKNCHFLGNHCFWHIQIKWLAICMIFHKISPCETHYNPNCYPLYVPQLSLSTWSSISHNIPIFAWKSQVFFHLPQQKHQPRRAQLECSALWSESHWSASTVSTLAERWGDLEYPTWMALGCTGSTWDISWDKWGDSTNNQGTTVYWEYHEHIMKYDWNMNIFWALPIPKSLEKPIEIQHTIPRSSDHTIPRKFTAAITQTPHRAEATCTSHFWWVILQTAYSGFTLYHIIFDMCFKPQIPDASMVHLWHSQWPEFYLRYLFEKAPFHEIWVACTQIWEAEGCLLHKQKTCFFFFFRHMLFATLKSFINTNLHSVKHHVFFNTFVNCPFQFQSTTLYTVYYRDLQSFTICTSPQTMTIFGATKTNATPQNRVPWHKECSASASICGCGSKASASSAMAPPRRRGRVRSSWEDAAERRWRRLGRQGESWGVLCRKATEISLLIGLYWAWHPPKNGENTFKHENKRTQWWIRTCSASFSGVNQWPFFVSDLAIFLGIT